MLLPVLLACASLTVMAGATIAPGLPGILEHFSDSPNAEFLTRLILSIPGLAIALSSPVAGVLADKLGRRVLLQLGVVLYIVAGSAGLWLDDLTWLLISRLFLGLAVGMVLVCSMALLTDHFQGAERDRAMGIQASSMSAGGILFITAGAFLADISWRAPFALYLLPIFLFPLIYKYVTKPPPNQDGADDAGGRFPVVHAAVVYYASFVAMVLYFFIPSQLPFFAIELGADSLKYAGFAIVLSQVFASIASASYQLVSMRLSKPLILLLSFILLSTGFYLLSRATSLPMVFVCMPLIGMGIGLNFPNMSIWLMSRVPANMRGRASGGMSTSIFLGQFISPLLSQPLINHFGQTGAYLGASLLLVLLVLLPVGLYLLNKRAVTG